MLIQTSDRIRLSLRRTTTRAQRQPTHRIAGSTSALRVRMTGPRGSYTARAFNECRSRRGPAPAPAPRVTAHASLGGRAGMGPGDRPVGSRTYGRDDRSNPAEPAALDPRKRMHAEQAVPFDVGPPEYGARRRVTAQAARTRTSSTGERRRHIGSGERDEHRRPATFVRVAQVDTTSAGGRGRPRCEVRRQTRQSHPDGTAAAVTRPRHGDCVVSQEMRLSVHRGCNGW